MERAQYEKKVTKSWSAQIKWRSCCQNSSRSLSSTISFCEQSFFSPSSSSFQFSFSFLQRREVEKKKEREKNALKNTYTIFVVPAIFNEFIWLFFESLILLDQRPLRSCMCVYDRKTVCTSWYCREFSRDLKRSSSFASGYQRKKQSINFISRLALIRILYNSRASLYAHDKKEEDFWTKFRTHTFCSETDLRIGSICVDAIQRETLYENEFVFNRKRPNSQLIAKPELHAHAFSYWKDEQNKINIVCKLLFFSF